jgi:hypothetical protein
MPRSAEESRSEGTLSGSFVWSNEEIPLNRGETIFLRQQNTQAAEKKNRGPGWRRGRTVALLKSKPTTQGGELREKKEPANKNHGNSVAGWRHGRRNSRENQPPDSGACGRNLGRRASNPNTRKEKPPTAAAQGKLASGEDRSENPSVRRRRELARGGGASGESKNTDGAVPRKKTRKPRSRPVAWNPNA